jgi:hypothetical protein
MTRWLLRAAAVVFVATTTALTIYVVSLLRIAPRSEAATQKMIAITSVATLLGMIFSGLPLLFESAEKGVTASPGNEHTDKLKKRLNVAIVVLFVTPAIIVLPAAGIWYMSSWDPKRPTIMYFSGPGIRNINAVVATVGTDPQRVIYSYSGPSRAWPKVRAYGVNAPVRVECQQLDAEAVRDSAVQGVKQPWSVWNKIASGRSEWIPDLYTNLSKAPIRGESSVSTCMMPSWADPPLS